MNSQELFRKYCEELGLNFDSMFFYKEANTYLKLGQTVQQQYTSSQIPEKKYIVRYYPKEDIYIVWYHILGRNSGSLTVPKDFEIKPYELVIQSKHRRDTWELENVFLFTSKGIKIFLERIVLPEI